MHANNDNDNAGKCYANRNPMRDIALRQLAYITAIVMDLHMREVGSQMEREQIYHGICAKLSPIISELPDEILTEYPASTLSDDCIFFSNDGEHFHL